MHYSSSSSSRNSCLTANATVFNRGKYGRKNNNNNNNNNNKRSEKKKNERTKLYLRWKVTSSSYIE
jgi:hypothetical protein